MTPKLNYTKYAAKCISHSLHFVLVFICSSIVLFRDGATHLKTNQGRKILNLLQNQTKILSQNKISKMSYIHVYFKSFGMTKYSRNIVFGWQDLIAFFGGICGLCLGFSLLSGAELVYWFTLRLFFDNFRFLILSRIDHIFRR